MSERPDVKPLGAEEERAIRECLPLDPMTDQLSRDCKQLMLRMLKSLDAVRAERDEAREEAASAWKIINGRADRSIECAAEALAALARSESRIAELVAALAGLTAAIAAHEIESLSCDRDGERYCSCLKDAAVEAREALTGSGAAAVIAAAKAFVGGHAKFKTAADAVGRGDRPWDAEVHKLNDEYAVRGFNALLAAVAAMERGEEAK